MQRPIGTGGDIRVFGLVAGTHTIEDIGRDVPHGMTVTIPADLAVRSKDLWRAISSKCLFQVPTAAAGPSAPAYQGSLSDPERSRLESHIRDLEAQLRMLSAENLMLREERRGTQDQGQKLDTILAAIQSGGLVAGSTGAALPMFRQKEEVADGSVPTFMPSEIKPRDVTVRIDVQGESSQADVSGAAERLRKMRKGES